MKGKIIGLARRAESRQPMEELRIAVLTPELGVLGDCKGRLHPDSQLTIMAVESWQAALMDLGGPAGPPDVPWTGRRANVLVEGVALPRGIGTILALGECLVQVVRETTPCNRMEDTYPGLRRALTPDWRGGVTCKVLTGGGIMIGDHVRALKAGVEARKVVLPGE